MARKSRRHKALASKARRRMVRHVRKYAPKREYRRLSRFFRRASSRVKKRKNPYQVARFPDGGFVLHKITGNWKGNVSAWFDKNGRPLDAEQMSGGFGSPARRVKRGGPIWDRLETIGKVWK